MNDDPGLAYAFALHLAGEAVARFQSIEGLSAHPDPIAYREGGRGHVRHLPGAAKVSPVTLRYGMTSHSGLWDWCNASLAGPISRRTASVTLYANDGQTEAARWTLFEAWPSGFRAAPLDAQVDKIAFEALTLVY
ncbi:MAG: phage tail protein, partial [Mameliella sp.]|nr:phage tail protein [Mameliella sp.]